MIISCPACTKPYELEDQRIAPLVQIACPSCEDTIILDFEAANDPQLIDPGTSTTLAYLTEADYWQSTDLPPVKSTAPTPTTKPVPSQQRPPAVVSLNPSPTTTPQESGQKHHVSLIPTPPGTLPPISLASPPPHTPSIATRPVSISDSSFADKEFDKVDTGIPSSLTADSFDSERAVPSPTRASKSGRRTMIMTGPMDPGVSNLPSSSYPPAASGSPSQPPPSATPQGYAQPQKEEEIQELEEFLENAEEFPAAAPLESKDAISSPLANPQPFPVEGRASLPLPQVGTNLPPPTSPGDLSPSAQIPEQQGHQELGSAPSSHAGASQAFGGQLDAAPERLPAKSSFPLTTILIFGLVAIVVAVSALCAFSLLQTGNPNPLPLLKNLDADNG